MSSRVFKVTPEALEQARKRCGFYGNVEERLRRMARHSAPFTCPQGNRRFDDYIMRVQQDVILEVDRLRLEDPVTQEVEILEDYRSSPKPLLDLTKTKL